MFKGLKHLYKPLKHMFKALEHKIPLKVNKKHQGEKKNLPQAKNNILSYFYVFCVIKTHFLTNFKAKRYH